LLGKDPMACSLQDIARTRPQVQRLRNVSMTLKHLVSLV